MTLVFVATCLRLTLLLVAVLSVLVSSLEVVALSKLEVRVPSLLDS